MSQVLVIDDNKGIAVALEVLFSIHGITCLHASTMTEGIEILYEENIDLLIQDMNFSSDTTSGEEGKALFHQIHTRHPDLPIILLTAWGNIEMAVELVKAGAADYLTKPWDDARLITTVQNLLELSQLRQQTQQLLYEKARTSKHLSEQHELCNTLFNSDKMLQALNMATQVAKSDVSVMITGPNGSGKEKIAEVIHANSHLSKKPFIKVNIGALPMDLMEAELFGAEAGAFTGAQKRIGRFEAADGGTLFLDEIGNLPLTGQVKLLRVLQTGEFERLGSSKTRQVTVRVISATNADLLSDIKQGTFREDLYYRLNVIEINLAPLCDRIDDILPLAIHFMPEGRELSKGAEEALLNYQWPGNVRELQNVIKRASLLGSEQKIQARDLGLPASQSNTRQAPNEPDKAHIMAVLAENKNNVTQAAKQLGITRQSLYRRMKKYGLE